MCQSHLRSTCSTCADELVIEIGWISLLAVPWLKHIRRISCHHIHPSKSTFFQFSKGWICGLDGYCHHWSFGFYYCYVKCSWWVMPLWQLFLMGHDWGSSIMLDGRFANHSAMSKWAPLSPLVLCLMVSTQTTAASTRWLNFWWKDFTGTDSWSVARLHLKLFCKPKLSHRDFELLYNNWIKDSLLFLSGHLSRNVEEQMLLFQLWEQQQL